MSKEAREPSAGPGPYQPAAVAAGLNVLTADRQDPGEAKAV